MLVELTRDTANWDWHLNWAHKLDTKGGGNAVWVEADPCQIEWKISEETDHHGLWLVCWVAELWLKLRTAIQKGLRPRQRKSRVLYTAAMMNKQHRRMKPSLAVFLETLKHVCLFPKFCWAGDVNLESGKPFHNQKDVFSSQMPKSLPRYSPLFLFLSSLSLCICLSFSLPPFLYKVVLT